MVPLPCLLLPSEGISVLKPWSENFFFISVLTKKEHALMRFSTRCNITHYHAVIPHGPISSSSLPSSTTSYIMTKREDIPISINRMEAGSCCGREVAIAQSVSQLSVGFLFSLLSLSLTRSFKFEHPCSPGISQGILHCIMWWEEGKLLTHCLTQHCTHMHPHIRNTRNNYFTLNFDALKLILLYIWRLKSHIWEPLKSSSSASCERFFPSLILPIPLSNTIIMSTKYSQHGKYHWRCTQLQ